jgi:hypothetical protein
VGVVLEFVGHGACGVNTKAGWLPYFHVFAIPDPIAWKVMPGIGTMDICLGIVALLAPFRALLLYMGIWGCFTALLRPAAGEGIWEFIERSYNYGIPLALLYLHGPTASLKDWFRSLDTTPEVSPERSRKLLCILRAIIALMLIGHGALGPFWDKKGLLALYKGAGLNAFGVPLESLRAGIGFFEIGLGVAALYTRSFGFFVFIFVWKLGSELLYPASGAALACWEVIERGGSYVAPLAALCVQPFLSKPQSKGRERDAI